MKYYLLAIGLSTVFLAGCGSKALPTTAPQPSVEDSTTQSKEELVDATEPGYDEPTFDELLKTANKDENGNIILTAQMRYAFPGCENTEAGFLPPNKNVSYVDKERGISFGVPYNDKWKFCGYSLNETDEMVGQSVGIEFGPLKLAPESGANLVRKYYLTFMSTSTPTQLLASLNDPLAEYKQMKINNLNVVREYSPPPTEGMGCSWLSYYVVGEKATYQFRGYCVETEIGDQKYSADEFSKELEQIIKTIKLI